MAIEYQTGNSAFHQFDPRTKLLLFAGLTVLSIIILDPVIIAVLFIILYVMGLNAVNPKILNANLRVLVVIFLTFALFNIIFFTRADSHILFYVVPETKWIPVTVEGLVRAAAVFFRFFIVVLAVHLLLYTTPPADLVLGLTKHGEPRSVVGAGAISLLIAMLLFAFFTLSLEDQISRITIDPAVRLAIVAAAALVLGFGLYLMANRGLPPEMGIALSIGFATVGILSQQTQKITDAQKARGYDVAPKNIVRRVQVLVALLIPIFLATLERSQDISVAILARAFDYDIARRTYRRTLRFKTADYLMIFVVITLILAGFALNYLNIGNPTEQFVLSRLTG